MADIVNNYFKKFYPPDEAIPLEDDEDDLIGRRLRFKGYSSTFPRILCADGFSMSVQAHWGAYSIPRDDFACSYRAVEIGFPSMIEPLIMDYCDNPEDPTETVYGYVPIELVVKVIEKHGGFHNDQNLLFTYETNDPILISQGKLIEKDEPDGS